MRPIDADALNTRIDKCVGINCLGLEPVMAIRDVKALISFMPTIDAISVEWLKRKMRQEDEWGNILRAEYIKDLIWEWQKEQEEESD